MIINNLNLDSQLEQGALESLPLDIFWINDEHKIIKANKTAHQNARKNSLELIGLPHAQLDPDFPESILTKLFADFSDAIEKGAINYSHQNGVENYLACIKIPEGNFVIRFGYNIISQGVENQPALLPKENSLFDDEHELAIKNALRIRSEFIANMNHEIRTPMNAIIGYAEMLAGSVQDRKHKKFAETIYKSGLSLVNILNDIMDLSKIESGRLKIVESAVRLDDVIREAIDHYSEQAENKSLQMNYTLDSTVPEIVLLDGTRLKQVIQNFLSNSIKFTQKGSIDLSVFGQNDDDQENGNDLFISIKDTGTGIPENEQATIESILNPTANSPLENYEVKGFGLPLCGRLISMMGGNIRVLSVFGKGTEIVITLPNIATSIKDLEVKPTTSKKQDKVSISSAKVLVVDDMDIIINVFSDYLSVSGVQVLKASNGNEAIAVATEEKPEVIFMDLNLPDKDGRQVTEELRSQPETENIPVVAMTGNLLDPDEFQPLFQDYLQKPFRFDQLKSIVDKYSQQDEPEKLLEEKGTPQTNSDLTDVTFYWDQTLQAMLEMAILTGALGKATDLGQLMKEKGKGHNDGNLIRLGKDLIDFAAEHNIISVESMLENLNNRNQ